MYGRAIRIYRKRCMQFLIRLVMQHIQRCLMICLVKMYWLQVLDQLVSCQQQLPNLQLQDMLL